MTNHTTYKNEFGKRCPEEKNSKKSLFCFFLGAFKGAKSEALSDFKAIQFSEMIKNI